MGRYKDYDRGEKRGYNDNQESEGVQSEYRPSAPQRRGPSETSTVTASQVVGSTVESIGTVKVYRSDKGFGFVGQDGGGKDVFVHVTALVRAGLSGLAEGQRVRMQVGQGRKGLEAQTIELLD